MSDDDPTCRICGEKKSLHVKTDAGPFTHPREARGEGTYVLKGHGHHEVGMTGEYQYWERWGFVPKEEAAPAGRTEQA